MNKNLQILLLAFLAFPFVHCLGQDNIKEERYTYKSGSSNGIGKWYMGREIAHVMGFQGIGWLERPEREKEENSSKLIGNMKINSKDVIADIGAGSGYHVFKLAPLANDGLIYAVDIQEEMLDAIRTKNTSIGYENIKMVLGGEKSVNLPENSIDKILFVDVYHELSHPYEIIDSIKKALKPEGKIFLIEYRGEDNRVPIKKLHKMTEAQAVKEMKAVGFILESNTDNLPWQHCMVFVKE